MRMDILCNVTKIVVKERGLLVLLEVHFNKHVKVIQTQLQKNKHAMNGMIVAKKMVKNCNVYKIHSILKNVQNTVH